MLEGIENFKSTTDPVECHRIREMHDHLRRNYKPSAEAAERESDSEEEAYRRMRLRGKEIAAFFDIFNEAFDERQRVQKEQEEQRLQEEKRLADEEIRRKIEKLKKEVEVLVEKKRAEEHLRGLAKGLLAYLNTHCKVVESKPQVDDLDKAKAGDQSPSTIASFDESHGSDEVNDPDDEARGKCPDTITTSVSGTNGREDKAGDQKADNNEWSLKAEPPPALFRLPASLPGAAHPWAYLDYNDIPCYNVTVLIFNYALAPPAVSFAKHEFGGYFLVQKAEGIPEGARGRTRFIDQTGTPWTKKTIEFHLRRNSWCHCSVHRGWRTFDDELGSMLGGWKDKSGPQGVTSCEEPKSRSTTTTGTLNNCREMRQVLNIPGPRV